MTHQFLIASYAKDFVWLRQCLRSLAKFSSGFLPPVVVVTQADLPATQMLVSHADGSDARVKVLDGPGFGRAQLAMMSGDIFCPDADFTWLLGSDCLATGPFSPETFCHEGKPVMLWNSWPHLAQHVGGVTLWKAGTERALGGGSHGEFMRRLPLAYPKALFPAVRHAISCRHRVPFPIFLIEAVNRYRNFSESNVMGEFAFRREEFKPFYHWVNIDDGTPRPPSPLIQFWSHGGLDRPRDHADRKTPRALITEILGSL